MEKELDELTELEAPAETPLSEQITCLLDALKKAKTTYEECNSRVEHMEQLTQDLLHALELQNNTYHERARIATELQKCRIARRDDKDKVQLTEALAKYLESKKRKSSHRAAGKLAKYDAQRRTDIPGTQV